MLRKLFGGSNRRSHLLLCTLLTVVILVYGLHLPPGQDWLALIAGFGCFAQEHWGTAVRLIYGWWWWLALLWLVSPAALAAWCVGALINDLGHLALDL